jgi:hypothetical protein
MKKLGLSFAFLAVTAFAGEWTGYISETKCGAKHSDGSEASISCVKGCIKGGAKPVFVVDGKVIGIANPDKVTEETYGKKVSVTGNVKDNVLTIDTVALIK